MGICCVDDNDAALQYTSVLYGIITLQSIHGEPRKHGRGWNSVNKIITLLLNWEVKGGVKASK